MNKIAHLFLLALAIAIMTMLAAIAWSQPILGSPSIYGKILITVTDSLTHKPIVGSVCRLIGTTQGAITKATGNGVIVNVRPATYSLLISAVGYKSDTNHNVVVLPKLEAKTSIALGVRPPDNTAIIRPPDHRHIEPIKDFLRMTEGHGFTIRGGRPNDSTVRRDPLDISDPVTGGLNPQSRFSISEIAISTLDTNRYGGVRYPIDTTSRVYKAYYKP